MFSSKPCKVYSGAFTCPGAVPQVGADSSRCRWLSDSIPCSFFPLSISLSVSFSLSLQYELEKNVYSAAVRHNILYLYLDPWIYSSIQVCCFLIDLGGVFIILTFSSFVGWMPSLFLYFWMTAFLAICNWKGLECHRTDLQSVVILRLADLPKGAQTGIPPRRSLGEE
jgi:hypothetical protein